MRCVAIDGAKARRRRYDDDMDITLELHCDRCGSAQIAFPEGHAGDAPILCGDCGEGLGDVAALRAELFEQAIAHSAEALRKGLEELTPPGTP